MLIDNGKFLDPNILDPIDKIFLIASISALVGAAVDIRDSLHAKHRTIKTLGGSLVAANNNIRGELQIC